MIGLEELLELVEMNEEGFKYIRTLSCDVIEINMLAGQSVPTSDRLLIGVTPCENNQIFIADHVRRTAHVLPNGIFEIHDGRWKGGIPIREGVEKSSKYKGEGKIWNWALVETEECNQLWYYARGLWHCIDPIKGAKETIIEEFTMNDVIWWRRTLETKECLHHFVRWATRGMDEGTIVCEMCDYCDEERERPALPEERVSSAEFMDASIHRVCHEFEKHMYLFSFDIDDDERALEAQGYDAMEKAEAFAEKYPHDVQIVGVDDSAFASSDLVLINHRTDKEFMGTTVFYIPQCHGTGSEFFLYPQHRKALIEALRVIDKQQESYPDDDCS